MNKIIIMGRVVRSVELKKTNTGVPVASITVAVNRSYGEGADFFSCTAWKKTAETAAKYLEKGRNVIIEGAMQSRKYKGKDGTEKTAWEIQVDRIHFCDSAKKSDGNPQKMEEVEDDGSLPF